MALTQSWLGSLLPDTVGIGYFLGVWHQHRTALLLLTFAVLLFIRIYLHQSEQRGDLVTLPKLYEERTISDRTDSKGTSHNDDKRLDKKAPLQKQVAKLAARPRRIKGGLKSAKLEKVSQGKDGNSRLQVLIFYSSVTTNTARLAGELKLGLDASLRELSTVHEDTFLETEVLDLADIDFDDYFLTPPSDKKDTGLFYAMLVPSYNIDTINDVFLEHLRETHYDFRIDKYSLSGLMGYSVFGVGDREGWPNEEEGFCFQAKEVDKWMAKLTNKKRAYPVGMGDTKSDHKEKLKEWQDGVVDILQQLATTGTLGEGLPGSGNAVESGDEDIDSEDGEDPDSSANSEPAIGAEEIGDLEDLGKMVEGLPKTKGDRSARGAVPVDFTTYAPKKKALPEQAPKEMVAKNSPTYASLTKQGYTIVGSHSGVKICRWTKSALRGRGSCYKFSFYGINSHQCMETTPSLSCSNKCVFCWRHGTNPVGTTWRWVVDPPGAIFDGVKAGHYQKIKVLRGMAGVRAERYAEALRIRHCALSLVGEPIFYPHINEFLALLHAERISSFLVCNAQHPDQLAALGPVTQLYVSIDASNKESLRRIDRPLHRDFWERFQRCLDVLRERRLTTRTVFRLTLVKGFNIEDEVRGYADLVERALPCFVEVKGVTFCGTSTSAGHGLRMTNVPFYHEVCDFVRALDEELARRGLGYGIAAEHAHSCCVLLGSERFKVDGRWRTLIDYERFFELLEEKGPRGTWRVEDYMGPETPEWATWGNGGFDPRDERVDRKGRKVVGAEVGGS